MAWRGLVHVVDRVDGDWLVAACLDECPIEDATGVRAWTRRRHAEGLSVAWCEDCEARGS